MPYDQKKTVEALRAFERGEIVVVMDDDGRENEGDLIVSATHCTPEKMAFIVRHTSGIVCAPMTRDEARRLNLAPMVADNDAPHSTAFTVSVDYKHGTTTGISADDRTVTVRNLANPNSGAADFVRPGHIFPLVAREGGVLMRSGHTEAAVDLCKLAGLPQVGVICELVNDDGTVMRGPQVSSFADRHGLKQVSVADLIAYRQRQETLVQRIDCFEIETPVGKAKAHVYALPWEPMHHLAIVFGDIRDGDDVPVRLHSEDVVADVFGTGDSLMRSMAVMSDKQRGVVVYLREGSVGVAHQARLRPGEGSEDHAEARLRESEWREIGLGAQILRDLGISSIDLLASRERHYVGLEGFGIRIARTSILER
jgi:3,4-dihydroxy 2-butanone 4-phosphate synthase/GTP cyclohydrolase II